MRDLSALREGGDTVEAQETRLLRAMTVQESIRQWQQRAAIFGPDRWAALAQLQARLRRIAEWQEEYGECWVRFAKRSVDPRVAERNRV